MTEADLVKLLSERFYGNFADETARRVHDAGAVDLLYGVATAPHPELPKPVRQKVLFRSAYVLERIWFGAPEAFMPHAEEFCRQDFAACANASARRHFGKSWPTCWDVIHPNRATGADRRGGRPNGPCRRSPKSP